MFELIATYKHGINSSLDSVLHTIVGKPSVGSGCMMVDERDRDIIWEFEDETEADTFASRINNLDGDPTLKAKVSVVL